jgi:hypothetical protein
MRQADLLSAVMRMKVGQAITLRYDELREAADGSIKSPLLDGPARLSDVDEFIHQIKNNWNIRVTRNLCKHEYTIYKVE